MPSSRRLTKCSRLGLFVAAAILAVLLILKSARPEQPASPAAAAAAASFEDTSDDAATCDAGDAPLARSSMPAEDHPFAGDAFAPGANLAVAMMKHAWAGYARFASESDQLQPLTRSGVNFSACDHSLALTAVDAVDILYMMGLHGEYQEARALVEKNVVLSGCHSASLFEVNIRILGGLLSAYALTADRMFLERAKDVGGRLIKGAFADPSTIFPKNDIDLDVGSKGSITLSAHPKAAPRRRPYCPCQPCTADGIFNLAQVGTLSLEFGYLSKVSGDDTFVNKATAIIKELAQMETAVEGLYPMFINTQERLQCVSAFTLGANADSFYEYLLKYWIFTGKKDEMHHDLYARAVKAIKVHHVVAGSRGEVFLVDYKDGVKGGEQQHLTCFAPGMLALGGHLMDDQEAIELAARATESCYMMYHAQATGLSPEVVEIADYAPHRVLKEYHQRPEVVESLFIMWRLTKDPKYRRWGYEIAESIERHTRIATGGYASLKSVTDPSTLEFVNLQESFFLAETLKYLFLLFSPDSLMPLDKWVLTTEAHPLPIQ